MEPQVLVEDWIIAGLTDRADQLAAEVSKLHEERESLLTELVIARRWVALLAAEVERAQVATPA